MATLEANHFVDQLAHLLCKDQFDMKKAEALSLQMHEAECKGYQVTTLEDVLWTKLSELIQSKG